MREVFIMSEVQITFCIVIVAFTLACTVFYIDKIVFRI